MNNLAKLKQQLGNSIFKRTDPWVISAIFAALCLQLFNLDEAALWFDERITVQQITLAWSDVIPEVLFGDYNANHVPLYLLLLKAWSSIVGLSPQMLRLPSVILTVVTVALVAGIAKTAISEKAARWSAWLAALSPYLMHHAQEARMYPLISALTAASIYILARYLKGNIPKLGALFVLINLSLLATHYYSMFTVSAMILVPLILLRRPLKTWILPTAVNAAGVITLMLMAILIAGHHSGENYDTGFIAFPGVIWSMISGYTFIPTSEELHAQGIRAILSYLPIALITVIPLGILVIRGLMAFDRDTLILVIMTISLPLLAPFLVTVIYPDVSINPRYVMSAAPPLLVLLGAGLAQGYPTDITVKISAYILIAVMASGSIRHLSVPGHGRVDIYAARDWLDKHIPVEKEILVTSSEMYHLAIFHWPDRRFQLYPDRKIKANQQNTSEIVKNTPIHSTGRTYYIIGRAWLSDANNLLQSELAKRYMMCPGVDLRGIRILCLEKPANSRARIP